MRDIWRKTTIIGKICVFVILFLMLTINCQFWNDYVWVALFFMTVVVFTFGDGVYKLFISKNKKKKE